MLSKTNDKFKYAAKFQRMMKEQALSALGLNEHEIKIYLANLRLGSSLVNEISSAAKLNRTSCYDLLKGLENKGFVSYAIKSGKRYYQATHPNKIKDLLKEKEKLVEKALPELALLHKSVVKKPSVEVYIGKEGVKSIFEDILRDADSFVTIASKKHLFKLFKYYFPHFVKRRIDKGIKARLITDAEPYDKKANYKVLKKKFKTATWVYNDKIAMVSLDEVEPIGIIIKEKNFADTYRMMFDIIWDSI